MKMIYPFCISLSPQFLSFQASQFFGGAGAVLCTVDWGAASLASIHQTSFTQTPCEELWQPNMSSEGEWEGAKLPPDENHCFNLLRPNTGFTMRRTHKKVVTRLRCRSKTFAHRVTTWRNLAGNTFWLHSLQLTKITQCKKYFCFIVCWNKILQIRLTNFSQWQERCLKSLHGHCWVLLVGCFYDSQSPSELRENTQVLRDWG